MNSFTIHLVNAKFCDVKLFKLIRSMYNIIMENKYEINCFVES